MSDDARAAPDRRAPMTHLLCLCGRCPGANVKLLEASDHALSDFDDHRPFVQDLLLGTPTGKASNRRMGQSPA